MQQVCTPPSSLRLELQKQQSILHVASKKTVELLKRDKAKVTYLYVLKLYKAF